MFVGTDAAGVALSLSPLYVFSMCLVLDSQLSLQSEMDYSNAIERKETKGGIKEKTK